MIKVEGGASEQEQEEIYGEGYHDGWWKGQEVVSNRSMTQRDWWLWVAAAFGFFLGTMV